MTRSTDTARKPSRPGITRPSRTASIALPPTRRLAQDTAELVHPRRLATVPADPGRSRPKLRLTIVPGQFTFANREPRVNVDGGTRGRHIGWDPAKTRQSGKALDAARAGESGEQIMLR